MGEIARQADEGATVGPAHLDRAARRPDILVVIVDAEIGVLAEAIVTQPGDRGADAEHVADRRADRHNAIGLVIAAIGRLGLDLQLIGQPGGHIFDRTADRVAPIERALRPAKHLDALHIVNVEQRSLRAIEIDVVDIDADARLETGHRILLADAANEGGERRVGAARVLQCRIGRHGLKVGQVDRADLLELLAGDRGDRDRHGEQRFLTTARGHDDVAAVVGGRLRVGRSRSRRVLRKGRGGEQGRRGDSQIERARVTVIHRGVLPSSYRPSRRDPVERLSKARILKPEPGFNFGRRGGSKK